MSEQNFLNDSKNIFIIVCFIIILFIIIFKSIIKKKANANLQITSLEEQTLILPENKTLINNVEELIQIIKNYSSKVFDESINEEIINFIIKTFINNDFYDSDGNFCIRENKSILINEKNKEIFNEFINLLKKYYNSDLDFGILVNTDNIVGKGSYGIVFKTDNKEQVIKLMFKYGTKKNTNFNDNFWFINDEADKAGIMYMIEICTYIIVMSIIKYIDCTMIIDSKIRKLCIDNRYQNKFDDKYFLNYSEFMYKIIKPDIKIGKDAYLLGYYMSKYNITLAKFLEDSNSSITKIQLLEVIFTIIRKIYNLSKIGIIISHRDLSLSNIMLKKINKDNYDIHIIDFNFLCININFKDSKTNKTFGYHVNNIKNDLKLCNKKFIDVLFLLKSIIRTPNIFKDIKEIYDINNKLETIINININIDTKDFASNIENNNFNEELFDNIFKIFNEAKEILKNVESSKIDDNESSEDVESSEEAKKEIMDDIGYGNIELHNLENEINIKKYMKEYIENKNIYLQLFPI